MKTLITLAFLLCGSMVFAQTDIKSLSGTYKLKIVDNIQADSSRVHLYGDAPKGILVFDGRGNYVMEIFSTAGRPPFAANDKSKGTNEEYRAAITGSNAHFGKYRVDVKTHTITFETIGATYPNWENTSRKSVYTFVGKTLRYIVPVPTSGKAVRGEVVWEKVE